VLVCDSNPSTQWEGAVERIAGEADETSRTFNAYIMVENRDPAAPLMPGMFVRAEVEGPTLNHALLIPRPAIRDEQVFIATEGKAEKRRLTIDRYLPRHVVITGGVAEGEWVIMSNLDRLQAGTPVEVSNGRLAVAP
jgi:multidrug efflux pump subunit AcrA (membrane-fusion protein)